MSYEQIDALRNWKLLSGSHEFPGPAGGTCINEAAIVAAGFPYQQVHSADSMPECFCPVLCRYALVLNDLLNDERRQILVPYVVRLAGTADTDDVQRARRRVIQKGLVLRVLPVVLRAIGLHDEVDALVSRGDHRAKALIEAYAAARALPLPVPTMQALERMARGAPKSTKRDRIVVARELLGDLVHHGSRFHSMHRVIRGMLFATRVAPYNEQAVAALVAVLDDAMAIGKQADRLDSETIAANLREHAPTFVAEAA